MRHQVEIFKPAHFIPFASFVVFSHQENFFMNEPVNRIRDVYRFATEDLKVPTQVMYPGDTWRLAEPRSSEAAIVQYERDFVQALQQEPDTSGKVPLKKLNEIAALFICKCEAKNNRMLLRAIPESVARLTDSQRSGGVNKQNS
jgi:hypothetical protein